MTDHDSDIVARHIKTKGKTRKIYTYRSDNCELRSSHERIEAFLSDRFVPSIFTKGYAKHCSIFQNAQAHLYNDYFIMLDIKDFFPHICHKQLSKKLFYEINRFNANQITLAECIHLVDLCSIGSRGLPLGFITSPLLSNIYLKEFDNIFYGKLKNLGLENVIYTRYADDLVISFRWEQIEDPPQKDMIIEKASMLLSKNGLQLNKKKTRSYNLNVANHVRITGVIISVDTQGKRKLSVGRSLKNDLFWRALACLENGDPTEIASVKGLQSFVLSIEKNGYEKCYSENMMDLVHAKGYASLKALIDSLNTSKN